MKLLNLLSSCILSGCCVFTPPKAPVVDAYLLSYCDEQLSTMPLDVKDWNTVFELKAQDNKKFAECVNKHKGLVNSVNKYTEEFKR
jgi:hypothetical protein